MEKRRDGNALPRVFASALSSNLCYSFSCLLPSFPSACQDKHPPVLNIPSKIKEHPPKKIPLKAPSDSWTPVAIPAFGLQIKIPIMDSFSLLWAPGSPQKLKTPQSEDEGDFLAPALTSPAEQGERDCAGAFIPPDLGIPAGPKMLKFP